jgi:hypothetical protein
MSPFKEKFQGFMLGLMVGLIIAGSFFILKLDNYFKELNFYKSISKTFSSTSKGDEYIVKPDETDKTQEKKSSTTTTKRQSIFNRDSTKTKATKTDLVLDSDTLNNYSAKDSLAANNLNTDDVIVRKDELLSTKTVEVINLNPMASRANAKDSLLQKVSGIRDDRNNTKQYFNIEFWQSPLNYKGYKMSKYKIVLYGIALSDGMKVFKLDDVIYLKNLTNVFKLDYASDFTFYERITDEAIISKLK